MVGLLALGQSVWSHPGHSHFPPAGKRTPGLLAERKLTVSCKFISNNCCTKGVGKTIFFKHHCTISYFLSKSSTYFSYKKSGQCVNSLYCLHCTHTKKNGGLTPELHIPNLSCCILILKLWFKISSNKNYAPAKAGNKILALPFLSCSPWLQAYLLCHKETHNRMRSNNKWKQYISPILLLLKTTLTSNFSP